MMLEKKLPDGFAEVKQLWCHMNHDRGICYSIEKFSIVRNAEGMLFLRRYKNHCDTEANGRPVTTIQDFCFRIGDNVQLSGINENNWKQYIADRVYNPSVIMENTCDDVVDTEVLRFVQKHS